MRYSVLLNGERHLIDVAQDAEARWEVRLDDQPLTVDQVDLGGGHMSLLIGNHSYDLFIRALPAESRATDTQTFDVVLDGVTQTIELVDERRRALTGSSKRQEVVGDVTVKAPMPGLVMHVLVVPGDIVAQGQRVVVLEAMKMQNDLNAPRAGVVRAVKTEQGQAVNQNQPLVVIGDPTPETPPDSDDE